MNYESNYRDSDLDPDHEQVELDRGETGVRILYAIVFSVAANIALSVLTVVILFQLGFALITQREPGPEIRRFANQTISYLVRIGRYLSYNDATPPFPFREFAAELDLTLALGDADRR
jgi:hypothetical protein